MTVKNKYLRSVIFSISFTFLFAGCGREKTTVENVPNELKANFRIKDFNAISNCENKSGDSICTIELDYFDAINTGFIIPSIRQKKNGMFICRPISSSPGNNSRIEMLGFDLRTRAISLVS